MTGITSVQLWAEDSVPEPSPATYNTNNWPSRVRYLQFIHGVYAVSRGHVCDVDADGFVYIGLHSLGFACNPINDEYIIYEDYYTAP